MSHFPLVPFDRRLQVLDLFGYLPFVFGSADFPDRLLYLSGGFLGLPDEALVELDFLVRLYYRGGALDFVEKSVGGPALSGGLLLQPVDIHRCGKDRYGPLFDGEPGRSSNIRGHGEFGPPDAAYGGLGPDLEPVGAGELLDFTQDRSLLHLETHLRFAGLEPQIANGYLGVFLDPHYRGLPELDLAVGGYLGLDAVISCEGLSDLDFPPFAAF